MPLTRNVRLAVAVLGGLVIAWGLWKSARLFYAVTVSYAVGSAERASAVWGVLLLASFTGWGSALNAWLFPRQRADWALRCAWGWGVALGVGGLLCAASFATRRVLVGFTAVGVLALMIDVVFAFANRVTTTWSLRRVRLLAVDAPYLFGGAVIFMLGAFHAFAEILDLGFNPNDDEIAYFAFAKEILQRGTLTQPFSLRRISAYGGKSLLDALQLAIDVPEHHLNLLDNGIALLTVMALVFTYGRSRRAIARTVLLLTMLFVLILPNTRINSATQMTGVVFFLGIYRTLHWGPIADSRGWRASLPVALLAAGACTLRQNYLVPVAVVLVVANTRPLLRAASLRPLRVDAPAVIDVAVMAALLVAFLAPWWILSLHWTGTFLFPMRAGNYNAAYSFFPHKKLFEWLHYVWDNISYAQPVKTIPIFLVAAITMPDPGPRRPFGSTLIAAFVGVAMLLYGYNAGRTVDQARYYFGFTVAAIVVISLEAASYVARPRETARTRAAAACVPIVLAALSMQLFDERDHMAHTFDDFLNKLGPVYENPVAWSPSRRDASYEVLQNAVPANAPIACLVDHPSHFDFTRNRIESLDIVGAISPPPGLPLAKGPDAVADYLLDAGYRYLIVVHPDVAANLYRRDTWQRALNGETEKVWKESAPFYLQAFDDFDQLRATRATLAEASGMTTLDLAARR